MFQATATPSAGIALGFDRDEDQNIPADSQPLFPRDEGRLPYATRGNDQTDEPIELDAMAMRLQQFCSDNNIEVDFNPNAQFINPNTGECHVSPNTVLNLPDQHNDDVSAMTPLTAWDGMSVVTRPARQVRGSNSSWPSSSSGERSIASHEIKEPKLPAQSEDPLPDMSPNISVLKELVGELLLAVNVELAIECLTNLIKATPTRRTSTWHAFA
ncbi:hypothetical protein THAOC_16047 [Thalassiosira oceanica]|uniref:Uncharacterized protein n=1 Tax=Thalassiosira oceanica TaxID=159749 RepID=K0SQJ1_THAOC|nr:hypothetical protein THAOC_16047 [Thalassiosira oceanica]|eukprot:EJK63306.1 hypothetical protein THAOC_16047 [Thalassiosira oceanica]